MQKQITSAEIEQHNIDSLPDTVEIIYPEDKLDARKDEKQNAHLDLSYANLKIDIANISDLKGEDFTLARRNGFGTSDSSVILGVNPYKTLHELILEKATPTISAEEKELSKNVAIRKGNDLEPLIIDKFSKQFQQDTWKPMDMYEHKDFPYLKFNFDGVTGKPGAYYPAEIKVDLITYIILGANELLNSYIFLENRSSPVEISALSPLTVTVIFSKISEVSGKYFKVNSPFSLKETNKL